MCCVGRIKKTHDDTSKDQIKARSLEREKGERRERPPR